MIAAFFHLYLGLETESTAPDRSGAPGWLQQPAALTQAFPTPRAAVSYIMDTIPIVKRKDEARWGDYRTQRVILEIYDALAESIRTGRPYQTRLDPPPADPRCCHPRKTTGYSQRPSARARTDSRRASLMALPSRRAAARPSDAASPKCRPAR